MLTSPGFGTALVNTLVYSVGGTFGAIVVGLVAALALRRPRLALVALAGWKVFRKAQPGFADVL